MEPLEDEAFVSSAWGARHVRSGGEGYFILVHGKCLSVSKALHTIRKQQNIHKIIKKIIAPNIYKRVGTTQDVFSFARRSL